MDLVGYARVSTIDQNLDIQLDALKKAGCKKIFSEKKSATPKKDRTAFDECMNYIREGDALVVTRIDRLTRNILDLQNLIHDLKDKKINLKAEEVGYIADLSHDFIEINVNEPATGKFWS